MHHHNCRGIPMFLGGLLNARQWGNLICRKRSYVIFDSSRIVEDLHLPAQEGKKLCLLGILLNFFMKTHLLLIKIEYVYNRNITVKKI